MIQFAKQPSSLAQEATHDQASEQKVSQIVLLDDADLLQVGGGNLVVDY